MYNTWSHTQRSLYALCPRKYQYAYHKQLRSLDPVGIEGLFSREVLHPVLAYLHAPLNTPETAAIFATECIEQFKEILAPAQYYTFNTVLRAIELYTPMVEADKDEGWSYIGTEVVKEHPTLTYNNTRYKSRIDVLLERNGQLLPVEFKFSTSKRERYWEIDQQLLGHAACCNSSQATIVEIVAPKPGIKARSTVSLIRQRIYFQSDLLKAWEEEARQDLAHLALSESENIWPKNTAACHQWGKPCPYLSICRSGNFADLMIRQLQEGGTT